MKAIWKLSRTSSCKKLLLFPGYSSSGNVLAHTKVEHGQRITILKSTIYCCCSVTKVVSNSLRSHGLQHPRLPCPSLSPRVCSNSCPLSQWCHPVISSSVIPLSSFLQSFPASGSFPMRQLSTLGGQGTGASTSASFQWILRVDFL